MNETERKRVIGTGRLAAAKAVLVVATFGLAGCAAGPSSGGRTQYKGDAVWTISSAGALAAPSNAT